MWRIVLVVVVLGCRPTAAPTPAVEPAPDFNARVLALISTYAPGDHGGYVWPSPDGQAGTTRDLRVGDHVVARGGEGNHCVGITLEVFWRALEACPGGITAAIDPATAADLKATWYVPELGGAGAADALSAHHLGIRVVLDQARPGDFVQAWTPDASLGHSMVFLGWDRDDAGLIVGIRYWSSQPWTDGIGESSMAVGDGGFALDRIHIARAACPRNASE